ncbi:PDZ and LIM domain protein Zasp-like isoform X2 [Planococcus citri]|uniref:PDZ and LIM domain protein Zasp-like isoform X2 n=1 Tax=Planococcus citri TaxID=170843 RepID=UPI0031F7A522
MWKQLRDTYREKRKEFLANTPRSGAGLRDLYFPTWKFYKNLQFLDPSLRKRQMISSVRSSHSQPLVTNAKRLQSAAPLRSYSQPVPRTTQTVPRTTQPVPRTTQSPQQEPASVIISPRTAVDDTNRNSPNVANVASVRGSNVVIISSSSAVPPSNSTVRDSIPSGSNYVPPPSQNLEALMSESEQDEDFETLERDEELNEALHDARMFNETPIRNSHQSRQGKRNNKSSGTLGQLFEIENRKMEFCQKHLEDADRQFLLSLVPELKALPLRQKSQAKIELQQVLLKYAPPDPNQQRQQQQ